MIPTAGVGAVGAKSPGKNGLFGQKLAQHVLQDPAVAEVALLLGRVDPDGDLELLVVGA